MGNSEIRILFAFDPWRSAILLIVGNKVEQWQRWYRDANEVQQLRDQARGWRLVELRKRRGLSRAQWRAVWACQSPESQSCAADMAV